MVNQMYLDKANVLIEALPYIQRFNRKIIVINMFKRNVIRKKPIIGGGKEIIKYGNGTDAAMVDGAE